MNNEVKRPDQNSRLNITHRNMFLLNKKRKEKLKLNDIDNWKLNSKANES